MVATDGYRLAKFQTTLEDGISGSERYIVPSRALSEAARNLSAGETIAVSALGPQSNQLQMTAGDAVHHGSLGRRPVPKLSASHSREVRSFGQSQHLTRSSAACGAPNWSPGIAPAW